jgi:tellurite resistance protein TehA-like permease
METKPSNSGYILNTSGNLVGLCFIALTSLKLFKMPVETFIDDITAGALVSFMGSCLLSFLSLRSRTTRSARYELIAEYAFLTGLILIFTMTILVTYNVIE